MKKYIFDYARQAKSISYGRKRNRKSIAGLVIHYTGNKGDTSKNNADFFATGNIRSAGAHIFIDGKGLSARSIPLNRVAWSVGNPGNAYSKGAYYSMVNNLNSVSIELCDIVDHGITDAQKKTLLEVCAWLKKQCPNIKMVVRHYDVVKKDCPHWYVKHIDEWNSLRKEINNVMSIKG